MGNIYSTPYPKPKQAHVLHDLGRMDTPADNYSNDVNRQF